MRRWRQWRPRATTRATEELVVALSRGLAVFGYGAEEEEWTVHSAVLDLDGAAKAAAALLTMASLEHGRRFDPGEARHVEAVGEGLQAVCVALALRAGGSRRVPTPAGLGSVALDERLEPWAAEVLRQARRSRRPSTSSSTTGRTRSAC